MRTFCVLLVCALAAGAPEASAQGRPPQSRKFVRAARPVFRQYIVRMRDQQAPGAAATTRAAEVLAARHAGQMVRSFRSLAAFVTRMNEADARALAEDPSVLYVEEDGIASIAATQTGAVWSLDRIDQRALPLSKTYNYAFTGAGVHAYVIDSGIRTTHAQFGGRASIGFDAVGDGQNGNDCHGHGTHVAGTIGGATFGVAKGTALHSVRVLACDGTGSVSGVIAGIDWVTANHVRPAVANMSLRTGSSPTVDEAIRRSVERGVTYVVAAGNDTADACLGSPASAPEAITVAASSDADVRASFSNYGSCVDLFAPGVGVVSASHVGDTSTATMDGTSMASPHVAGAAALYLEANAFASPQAVAAALVSKATPGAVSDPGPNSPNLLLYTGTIAAASDQTPPTVSIASPASGATVKGLITLSANASDNVAISQVRFFVDETLVATVNGAPYSVTWDSGSVPNGKHTIVARALDTAGNQNASAGRTFTVAAPGRAAYDAALMAPRCSTPDKACDSTTLLDGRAQIGPEVNAPNTIYNSCSDGTSGSYHGDESLDRLRIFTRDGSTLAPGKGVRIEATVWAYSPTDDVLDVYSAPDATSPTWSLLASVKPAAAGATTLTVDYTLPAGSLQAIRGVFRYSGAPATCGAGGFDDTDDLVFSTDVTAPTIAIASPAAGAVVAGTISISANASDAGGVARVVFYDGASALGTDTRAPYSVAWNTATAANGTHQLTARAYDMAGNSTVSSRVTVTVQNGGGAPAVDLVASGGFEPMVTGWTKAGAAYFSTGGVQHSGIGYGYLAKANSAVGTLSQQISIPPGTDPFLSFWLNVTSDEPSATAADRLFVEVLNSSGARLATLATYSNVDKGATGAYVLRSGFSLGAFAGQTVRLQFRAATNATYVTAFRIDDVSVKDGPPPPAATDLIASGGFEPTVTGWTRTGASRLSTGGISHTGSGYAYLAKANGVTGTLTQQIAVPAGTNPSLSFWLNATSDETSTTASDYLWLEVLNAAGTRLATLATYTNLDKGPTGAYEFKGGFPLGAYAGQTIHIQFRAATDAVNVSAFRIDDVSVR